MYEKLLRAVTFAAASSLMSVASCAAPVESAGAGEAESELVSKSLDVNDVSFLFPVAWNSSERDAMLRLDTTGSFGPLLAKPMFEAAFAMGNVGALAQAPAIARARPYAMWRIVAARFDPCAARPDNASACAVQLRLVAQPIVDVDAELRPAFGIARVGALDFALHLVYELPTAEATALVAQLRSLKAASSVPTTGKVLHVHPAMAREGINGTFAQALKRTIVGAVGTTRLARVTFFGSTDATATGEGTRWGFAQGVVDGGRLVPAPLLGVASVKLQVFDSSEGEGNPFKPVPTPPEHLGLYFTREYRTEFFEGRIGAARTAAVRSHVSIENPLRHSVANTDCASCHLPRVRAGEEALIDIRDVRFVAPVGTTVQRSKFLAEKGYVLRAFGHVETKAAVSQRTINESAAVADYVNTHFAR